MHKIVKKGNLPKKLEQTLICCLVGDAIARLPWDGLVVWWEVLKTKLPSSYHHNIPMVQFNDGNWVYKGSIHFSPFTVNLKGGFTGLIIHNNFAVDQTHYEMEEKNRVLTILTNKINAG